MGRASPATFSNKKPRGFLFVRGLAGGEKGVQPRPDPLPVEGGELVLRGGIGVSGARKEQPFGVVFERRGFQRPFDDPVFDEDEIGVFAHDLAHEGAFGAGEVARAEHPDFHDALEAVLGDGEDLPAEQVFAEEHAEIGGDGRRFFFLPGEADAGVGGVCGKKEFDRRLSGVYNKSDLVLVRLGNAVDFPAAEEGIEFGRGAADMESILWHVSTSFKLGETRILRRNTLSSLCFCPLSLPPLMVRGGVERKRDVFCRKNFRRRDFF